MHVPVIRYICSTKSLRKEIKWLGYWLPIPESPGYSLLTTENASFSKSIPPIGIITTRPVEPPAVNRKMYFPVTLVILAHHDIAVQNMTREQVHNLRESRQVGIIRVAKRGMTDEPQLRNVTYDKQMSIYFSNHNCLVGGSSGSACSRYSLFAYSRSTVHIWVDVVTTAVCTTPKPSDR